MRSSAIHGNRQLPARFMPAVRGRSSCRKLDACHPWQKRTSSSMAKRCFLVRKAGLEPARVAPLEPKSSASTSSATFALLDRDHIAAGEMIAPSAGGRCKEEGQTRSEERRV